MLRRVRTADLQRVAEVRLQVRPMYPTEASAARAAVRAAASEALAHRMKRGIRRLGHLLGRVGRDGLAQFLRVSPSERPHDRK